MDDNWRAKQKKRDQLLSICGAVAGAIALIILMVSTPFMMPIHGAAGGFIGYMTVQMRSLADGWQGWLASIAFWWGLPLVLWLFSD